MVTFYKPKKNTKALNNVRAHIKDVRVTGLDHQLRGVAKQDNRTLFIPRAMPGERVNVDIVKSHARFDDAVVTKVLTPSPDRISPMCKHFDDCGGCALQMMPAANQLASKQAVALEQLDAWANITPAMVLPALTGPSYGYRQKARLQVDVRDGHYKLGFIQRAKKSVFTIEQCPVLDSSLELLVPKLRHWLEQQQVSCVSHIELTQSAAGSSVVVRHTRPLEPSARQALQTLKASVWFQGDKKGDLTDINNETVDPRLTYVLNNEGLELQYSPKDFIQSNPVVNQAMISQAVDWLKLTGQERIVELFSGMGNFTMALAKYAKHLIAVEVSQTMVERARENARINKIDNIDWQVADLNDNAFTLENDVDIVVLDPPRSGAQGVLNAAVTARPCRILYVSCNSATFARDANTLVGDGYHLKYFNVMDMFPQTAHVEVMGLFERSQKA